MKKVDKKINASWHSMHPMPKNPTLEQRLQWHIGHAKNCACREMPERLKKMIRFKARSGGYAENGRGVCDEGGKK